MPTFTETYDFSDSTEYTYDTDDITIAGGQAQLKLQDNPGETFSEDFADDTGFSYDSGKAEFSGGQVQQKDTRPADATFYASFNSDINGNWGGGVLTGTSVGGASVSGGNLDLGHEDVRYVEYDADLNADSVQVGCVRMRITPQYSGSPATNQFFVCIGKQTVSQINKIVIYHATSGQLRASLTNSSGVGIVNFSNAWSPTTGTEYEIEFNWDLTAGALRIFVDGAVHASDSSTGTRDSNIGLLRIGEEVNPGSAPSDFLVNDILIFSTVQHTTTYTPDWSGIYEAIYVESKVELPAFSYTDVGAIQAFTNLTTTESNSPQQVWNDLYWDGAAWSASDGSFAQSNSVAEIVTNIASFPASDTLNVDVVFESSDTQMSISQLDVTYTGQIYPTTNPNIVTNETFTAEALISFVATLTEVGSAVEFLLLKDSVYYRWNGTAWVATTLDYANANTASEFNDSSEVFFDGGTCSIVIFLHSDDGTTTPEISSVYLEYDWFQPAPELPDKCIITGYIIDAGGNLVEGAAVTAEIAANDFIDDENYLVPKKVSLTSMTGPNGRFEIELFRSTDYEASSKYKFTIKLPGVSEGIIYENITIPDQDTADFDELV